MVVDLLRDTDSLLLIIDVQTDFYAGRDDVNPRVFDGFVERAAWVTGLAEAFSVPTVVTEEDPDLNGHTVEAIASRLPTDTPRFDKRIFGAADDDAILSSIQALDRRTAILVGMETDVCVAHTAIGLRARGYRVAAVIDATFAPGQSHQHGLDRMRGSGIELISAKALYYEWARTVEASRAFRQAHPDLASPPGFSL